MVTPFPKMMTTTNTIGPWEAAGVAMKPGLTFQMTHVTRVIMNYENSFAKMTF